MRFSVLKRRILSWLWSRPEAGLAYWEDRARTYGARAVLNLGHPADQLDAVTRRQVDEIFPHLSGYLSGEERVVLDFGCGPGRFTAQLAEAIHGAIGVDPIQSLIELAPRRPEVEYRVSDGRRIPLPDSSVDIAWVCLVLGGLPDAQLAETVSDLQRVLRPGGLVFLVENTSAKESCPHWAFRPVTCYQQMFPFAPLDHLHDYDDLGERISIMAGRKTSVFP